MAHYREFDSDANEWRKVKLIDNGDGTYSMAFAASIDPGDINIGTIELKDGSSGTLATVQTANTSSTGSTTVLAVQPLDASGNIIDQFTTTEIDYTVLKEVDSGDSSIQYFGKALPGSVTSDNVWQIMRLSSTATGFSKQYAGATPGLFDNIWDDRESLTYS